jgi:glycerate 2-kinase
MADEKSLLRALFEAAISAANPGRVLARHLPAPPKGRTLVIGAGKAAASMARAVEAVWPGDLSGIVVTRYGHHLPTRKIEVVEASHPIPDEAGLAASGRILASLKDLTESDLVLCLMSGGASALLPLPLDGLRLEDEQALNKALLQCGATISEMNCVRRHLSAIKGGRLGLACHPARLVTLLISDVPGDAPADIGSGPTIADPTTCGDALAVIARYGIATSDKVREVLASGRGESVKPGDPRLANSEVKMIATPQMALEAAADAARKAGVPAYILSDRIEGEARDVGKALAAIARQVARHQEPFAPPCVLLSGGETTVTVRGKGRGGRNVEFLLSLGISLDGHPGIFALAGDTDGVDGIEETAGAYLGPDSLARAWKNGIKPQESLAANDGHSFFEALGDSIVTGPTLTNVNDFRAILISKEVATG